MSLRANLYGEYRMSKSIQFNRITKVKKPESIKNGVDVGKLSCEWIDAASAPSHIKKMGILRKVEVSDINLHDAVTQINSGIPVGEIRHDPYLKGYSYRGKDNEVCFVSYKELEPYRTWKEYKAYLFEREYIGHIQIYMFPVEMKRDAGTITSDRLMKIAKKYVFSTDTDMYRDQEILEVIMKAAFIAQEPDCIVEYYID